MVLILLVWIRFTFLTQFYYIFHSFHIFKISKHNVYLHTVRLTIWYQLFLQLWLVHTLFFPFHVINMQQLASWSIKLDINVLNRQLLRDSLIVDRITTSPKRPHLWWGAGKLWKIYGWNYRKRPFSTSFLYLQRQANLKIFPPEICQKFRDKCEVCVKFFWCLSKR